MARPPPRECGVNAPSEPAVNGRSRHVNAAEVDERRDQAGEQLNGELAAFMHNLEIDKTYVDWMRSIK